MLIHEDSTASLPFFSGLAAEDAKALAPFTRIRDCGKKQQLFWAGDPATSLFLVMSGRVKLYLQTEANQQTVIRISGRGDVIGLIPLLEDPPVYPFSAETMAQANLLEIDMGAARRALASSPGFLHKILKAMTNEVRANLEIRHAMALPATRRVGWLLLRLSEKMIGKGGTFRFPYDKGAAAAELCMSPETFSRALAQLKCAGVRCAEGQVTIDDFETLRQYVSGADGMPAAESPPVAAESAKAAAPLFQPHARFGKRP